MSFLIKIYWRGQPKPNHAWTKVHIFFWLLLVVNKGLTDPFQAAIFKITFPHLKKMFLKFFRLDSDQCM